MPVTTRRASAVARRRLNRATPYETDLYEEKRNVKTRKEALSVLEKFEAKATTSPKARSINIDKDSLDMRIDFTSWVVFRQVGGAFNKFLSPCEMSRLDFANFLERTGTDGDDLAVFMPIDKDDMDAAIAMMRESGIARHFISFDFMTWWDHDACSIEPNQMVVFGAL